MKAEGWKQLAIQAVRAHDSGDDGSLDLLGRLLEEVDATKTVLHEAGVSWSGRPLIDSVRELVS